MSWSSTFRVQIPLAFGTTFTYDGHLYICLTRNTDSGLQNRELLQSLLRDAVKARNELPPSLVAIHRPRLVLKIAPDLEESQLMEMQRSYETATLTVSSSVTRP